MKPLLALAALLVALPAAADDSVPAAGQTDAAPRNDRPNPLWGLFGAHTICGQTRPSAYYLQDDIQFFPVGPEFKAARVEEKSEAPPTRTWGRFDLRTLGGQTLPSAYYLRDDVQYFPAGPEFKLSNAEQAAVEEPVAADDMDRYSLNLNAGINSKFGMHVAVGFEDKVRGIAVPPVTLPVSLIIHPRIEGLTAFANWLREQDDN